MISNLKREGSIEVGIHPGYNEKWRIHEKNNLENLSKLIKNSDKHSIINWENI